MDLQHLHSLFEVKALDQEGLFEGYASVFDTIDGGSDVVARGAFADTLKRHATTGSMPKMLWQHNPAEPVGVWHRMAEDSHGLHVEGKLLKGSIRRAAEIHALMQEGAIDGLSIGYSVIESSRDEKTGVRRILHLDLWEASIVAFPMNDGARISSLKAALIRGDTPKPKEFEAFLREAGGLSRNQARAVMARGYAGIRLREAGDGAGITDLLHIIRTNAVRIRGHQTDG